MRLERYMEKENEVLKQILDFANSEEGVRAVMLNGLYSEVIIMEYWGKA